MNVTMQLINGTPGEARRKNNYSLSRRHFRLEMRIQRTTVQLPYLAAVVQKCVSVPGSSADREQLFIRLFLPGKETDSHVKERDTSFSLVTQSKYIN